MEDGQPVPGSLYVYVPNKVAPIFFTVAFAASATGHIWQCFHYKCFKLIWLHPFCAVVFTVGYALREYGAFNYSYSNTENLIIYVLSQVFIYICPPLLELANYHVLGRIFYYVPYLSPLSPGKVRSTFGALMALVETINALGVSLSSKPSASPNQQELGRRLTISALVIQLVVIITFVSLASTFHRRCNQVNIQAKAILTLLVILYISMSLILIRCVYRLVEHLGNTKIDLGDLDALRTLSPILRYEWFFYVFEATLMLFNSVLWNIWCPGRYLPRDHHVYLAPDGTTELKREEKPDGRSLLLRIVSALTFGCFFRKKENLMIGTYPTAQRQA
ncbi:RTA1 like protein [Aspergillus sclerotialis]|uniref:RTA1 like protein n=1 Tax=Aspergillus sclerotialis TaxID=2070753 RepID=A0A3A2ZIR4_9EURO|nr:RTA1 like protein [Aspergillus sclerotialis]